MLLRCAIILYIKRGCEYAEVCKENMGYRGGCLQVLDTIQIPHLIIFLLAWPGFSLLPPSGLDV